MILQTQLDSAIQKEKNCLQTMVSKEVYEDVLRKSGICQDDLTKALEKVRPHLLFTKKVFKEIQGLGVGRSQFLVRLTIRFSSLAVTDGCLPNEGLRPLNFICCCPCLCCGMAEMAILNKSSHSWVIWRQGLSQSQITREILASSLKISV